MERRHYGAQRMAGHRFGERERDIALLDSSVERDSEALDLYIEMTGLGVKHAADAMLARYRIRFPDTHICSVGPHLLGTAIWTQFSLYDTVVLYGVKEAHPRRCPACFEHRMKEMREKSYGATNRVPDSMRRVQQSQHRPGASREAHWFGRVRHYDYPWRRSRHGNLVLKKTWEGVKGLTNPQYIDYRSEAAVANDRIISDELERRAKARGKKVA